MTGGDVLPLPEIGIEIPVTELYEGVDLPAAEDSADMATDAPPDDSASA